MVLAPHVKSPLAERSYRPTRGPYLGLEWFEMAQMIFYDNIICANQSF